MPLVIRKYRPQDKDAVCSLFSCSNFELIRPCFYNSVSSPLHLLITLALFAAGYLLGSVPGALVLPGVWIALIYYSCHNIYSSYVQQILQTNMRDIAGNFLSRPDDCFWVAEAQVDERPKIIGTVAIKTKQSGEGRQAELFRMAISSSYRRMGLGIRMAKIAIDFCKERGISGLVLETTNNRMAAVNLYKKLGFSIVCTQSVFNNYFWVVKLAKVKVIRMELRLARMVGESQFSWREHTDGHGCDVLKK
ncbi:putative N-acetyltransferase camello [Nelusetta ayraudi]|uniref:putative N-acetyltransferase camello n=1 Tax=Nelusetta ayraudi TaxID=303726 RepID=UPI003F715D44